MVQFASYLRRVLSKTRLIFSRINGPNVEQCLIPLLTYNVVHSTGYFSLSPQPGSLDQYYLETLGQQGLTLAVKKKKQNKKKIEC